MRTLFRIAGPVLAAGMLVAGLATATQAAGTITVGTASTTLGTVLVSATGLTLYTHAGDTSTMSSCTGGCAAAWPPLTVPAGQQPNGGPGVTGQLGTFVRPGGSTQVTYNGLPLYGWEGDRKPGDVTGQGLEGFSVARPGTPAPGPTAIIGSLRAGATRAGPFSARTLVLPNGRSVTVRFHLGKAFVGKSVSILLATRQANGKWSAYHRLTVRHVEADGYAYVFVHVHGSEAFRGMYAGDATHGAGTSQPVMARGM